MSKENQSVADIIEKYTGTVGAGFLFAVSGLCMWLSVANLA